MRFIPVTASWRRIRSFAAACETEGIKFIGPSSRVLELMGDKVAARREMVQAGVPVVPGTDECIAEFEQASGIAAKSDTR